MFVVARHIRQAKKSARTVGDIMGGDIGMFGLLIERLVAICGWGIPIVAIIAGIVLYIKKRVDKRNDIK